MFSLLVLRADGLNALVESWCDGVEDGGFSDTALTDDDTDPIFGKIFEPIDTPAAGSADEDDGVSQLGIGTDQGLKGDRIDQVAFVDADRGIEMVLFGGSENPIDQIGFDRRFCGAGDDEELIDIGDDHVPTFLARAAQFRAAVLDTNNPALVGSVGFDIDAIAGDHNMALLGGEILKNASDGTP